MAVDRVDRSILSQVQSLLVGLSAKERQDIIQAITNTTPPTRAAESSEPHHELLVEQRAWFAKPISERWRYRGQFVAVHNGEVVDHDSDKRALYLRVRANFGHRAVLITDADRRGPRVFTFRSVLQEE